MGTQIFTTLQQKLGTEGRFYMKEQHSHDLFEVDADKALKRVLTDLRSRNKHAERWHLDGVIPTFMPEEALEAPSSSLRIIPSSIKEVGKHNFVLSWYNDEYTVRMLGSCRLDLSFLTLLLFRILCTITLER